MKKNTQKITIALSTFTIFSATLMVSSNHDQTVNLTSKIQEDEKDISSRVLPETTATILTAEIVATLGWNDKVSITLNDWKRQAPYVVETSHSFVGSMVLTSIEVPSQIKVIGEGTFSYGLRKEVTFEPNSQLEIIGRDAFRGAQISNIIIPKSVKILAVHSFMNASIEALTFEEGSQLETIGENAFGAYFGTSGIIIPKSLKTIGDRAFEQSRFTSFVFEEGSQLETIGQNAFATIPLITELKIPKSVKTIGGNAFQGNNMLQMTMYSNLKKYSHTYLGLPLENWNNFNWIYMPINEITLTKSGVLTMGWDVKKTITLNDWKTFAPNVKVLEPKLWEFNLIIDSIEIPSNIKYLSDDLFHDSNLSQITFQENSLLESIKINALSKTRLKTIVIPSSVKTLETNAFFHSPSLKEITFEEGSQLDIIGESAFSGTILELIDIPLSVTVIYNNALLIPSLTTIWMSVSFKGLEPKFGLTPEQWNVINWIDKSSNTTMLTKEVVESIGWNKRAKITLRDWQNTIPNVVEIKRGSFENNNILESIEIPAKITIIDDHAFTNSLLSKVLFQPESKLRSIGPSSFEGTQLLEIIIPINVETIGSDTFASTNFLSKISMPSAFKNSSNKFGLTDPQWNSIVWISNSNNKLVVILSVLIVSMIIPLSAIGYTVKEIRKQS